MSADTGRPHILIAGGGYVGMYTALTLQRKLRRGEARVTVVDLRSYMTYQPFLPEAAAGSLEPRHVVVPLRRVLDRRKVEVVTGRVVGIDHGRKVAQVVPRMGHQREVPYDVLVVAFGSIVRTLPIPGLAETGIGFKRIEEAIRLRNQVIENLDIAVSTDDKETRRRALTFVVVGGGYAGVRHSPSWRTWLATPPGTTRASRRTTCAGCWSRPRTASCPRWARTSAGTPWSVCASGVSRCG